MIIQLLHKEIFSQKPYVYFLAFIWFFPITGFFTGGSAVQHILLVILLASWVPQYVAYYEQPALDNTLPVTRKKIITAKYMSPLMWFIPSAIIVMAYVFLFVTYAPFPARLMTGWDLLLALAILYVMVSIFFPLQISFGYVPAMIITVAAAVSISIGVQMVINIYHNPRITSLDSFVESVLANPNMFIILLAAISLIITLLSYSISTRIYEHKDF